MLQDYKRNLLNRTQTATSILLVTALLQACGGSGGGSSLGEDPKPSGPSDPSTPSDPSNPRAGSLTVKLENLSDNIPFGSESSFVASVDGAKNTLQYSLSGAPEGMTIDPNTGVVSWTPQGLMFSNKQTFSFTITATDDDGNPDTLDANGSITGSATVVASDKSVMTRSSVLTPTLENTIKVGDFDQDGKPEILSTDNKGLLYTLELNSDTNEYEQNWVYPYAFSKGDFIKAIDIGDITKDGFTDFIVLNKSSLNVIDGKTRELAHTFAFTSSEAHAVGVADIDNDQILEIATLTGITDADGASKQQLTVYKLNADSNRLSVAWEASNEALGKAMVIGQLDSDAPLEIATQGAFVFDGVSQSDQWTNVKPLNWGDQIVAVDLDNDGVQEIATLSGEGFISVFSAAFSSDLFSRNNVSTEPETTTCAITSGNVDSDPEDELIAGHCSSNGSAGANDEVIERLYILTTSSGNGEQTARLRPQTILQRFVSENEEDENTKDDKRTHTGFLSLTLADTDGDGKKDELIWANRFTENNFYRSFKTLDIGDGNTNNISITYEHDTNTLGILEGGFLGAHPMQITTDKESAVFSSYSKPAQEDTKIKFAEYAVAIDYNTGQVKRFDKPISLSNSNRSVKTSVSGDFTDSGHDQLVLSASFSNKIFDLDNEDEEKESSGFLLINLADENTPFVRQSSSLAGAQINGPIASGKINNDSISDIIINIDSQLMSYNLGVSQLWNSTNNFDNAVALELGDMNGDGVSDLSVMFETKIELRQRLDNRSFYDDIFGGAAPLKGTKFVAQDFGDLNGNGSDELIVADQISDSQTKIRVFSITNNKTKALGSTTIDGTVQDLLVDTRNGSATLLVGWTKTEKTETNIGESYISAFGFNSSLSAINPLWKSDAILGQVQENSMNIRDNGQLLIGTEHAMYITQ